MRNKEIIGYAIQYVSYVIYNLEPAFQGQIKEIILFGSVARGEATVSSDVDIFFSVPKENKSLSRRITELTNRFYTTEFYRLWKNLGIEQDLKPIIGVLKDWNLKSSLIANGITLWGKYKSTITGGSPLVIIYWPPVKNQSQRILLSKRLYGYSYKKKHYRGLLSESALKLSSNCLAIPLADAEVIMSIFKKMNVPFKSMYLGKME